jgi:hypothetical protein
VAVAAATTGNRAVDAPLSGISVEAPTITTTTEEAGTSMDDEPLDGRSGWHRQVAVDAFNQAWLLIDQPSRTPEQERELFELAFASRYHWGVIGGEEEAMVGDWLIAHVASLEGFGELAHRFASTALDRCRANGWSDWRLASTLEGMARASAATGDDHARDRFAAEARRVLATIEDKEDRELIASQLASIPGLSPA